MAFLGSLGKFLGGVTKAVQPIFSTIAPALGPLGLGASAGLNVLGGQFGGGEQFGGGAQSPLLTSFGGPFGFPAQLPVPRPLPMPRPFPRPQPFPGPFEIPQPRPAPRGPTPLPIPMPSFGGQPSAARTFCSQIRMSYLHQTGMRMPSISKIKRLITTCGMDQAVATLRIDTETLCRFLLLCKPRKRPLVRRSDLRACRRVVSSLGRLQHMVSSLRVGGARTRVQIGTRRRRCPVCRKNPCSC